MPAPSRTAGSQRRSRRPQRSALSDGRRRHAWRLTLPASQAALQLGVSSPPLMRLPRDRSGDTIPSARRQPHCRRGWTATTRHCFSNAPRAPGSVCAQLERAGSLLSLSQVCRVHTRMWPHPLEDLEQMRLTFAANDLNKDGVIDLPEFEQMMARSRQKGKRYSAQVSLSLSLPPPPLPPSPLPPSPPFPSSSRLPRACVHRLRPSPAPFRCTRSSTAPTLTGVGRSTSTNSSACSGGRQSGGAHTRCARFFGPFDRQLLPVYPSIRPPSPTLSFSAKRGRSRRPANCPPGTRRHARWPPQPAGDDWTPSSRPRDSSSRARASVEAGARRGSSSHRQVAAPRAADSARDSSRSFAGSFSRDREPSTTTSSIAVYRRSLCIGQSPRERRGGGARKTLTPPPALSLPSRSLPTPARALLPPPHTPHRSLFLPPLTPPWQVPPLTPGELDKAAACFATLTQTPTECLI